MIAIHSTIHPQTARDIAALAAETNVDVLDAPVTHPFGVHGIDTATAFFSPARGNAPGGSGIHMRRADQMRRPQ